MRNISDYIDWRGDLTFEQSPFNNVDNLILAQLSYVDFRDIVPEADSRDKITLEYASKEFFYRHDEDELKKSTSFIKDVPFFMKKVAVSTRFKDILLSHYVDIVDEEKQQQFSAFHANLGDGTVYVAFRGTDDTLVGWKEDFNMSCITPVPSQIEAARYLNSTIGVRSGKVRLGGHSKGGNLAIFAAVMAVPKVKRKIIGIYNNDGPGFDDEMLLSSDYKDMLPRIKTIVPEHSVVGMLLGHEERYLVVKSSQSGIMQHDAMSWQVIGNRFDRVEHVSKESKILNKGLSNWMNGLENEQRKQFVDTLFDIILASGAKTLSDINTDMLRSANASIKMYNALDSKTRAMMRKLMMSLTSEIGKARRASRRKRKV